MIAKKNTTKTKESIIADYLVQCRIKGLSEATLRNYRYDLDLIFREFTTIDEKSINDYLLTLSNSTMTTESKNHYLRCLKTFVRYLTDEGILTHQIQIHSIRGQVGAVRLYTDEECRVLLTKEKNETFVQHRTRVMIAFIMATGCRANTIINIRLEDCDFVSHTILFRELKNKTTYFCPLSLVIEKELKNYISTWDLPADGYLFCNEDGEKLKYSAFRLAFDRRCKRLGINGQGLHALRHTFASNYIKNGGDVFSLSRQLTHSSIQITQKYIHLANSDIAEKVNKYNMLDNLLTDNRIKKRCI